ncbi:hypothetical protein FRC11_013334 [Ceratobasidium sp. 423]|nr:hypothetical protein FRC11_013334 [Ceratobasidium sp. 423]
MPRAVPPSSEHLEDVRFVQAGDILCVLSTFHNCARWACPLERSKVVMQERQETSLRALAVRHQGDLSDILINVASLRSASFIQQLRTPMPLRDVETLARVSVQKWQAEEEKAQQEKEQKAEKKAKSKAKKEIGKKRKVDDLEEPQAGPSGSRCT